MGEMIKYGVKLAISIVIFTALFAALGILFNFVVSFTYDSIFGEVIHIVANCLPLNSVFWGGLLLVINGIIAFLLARKVWEIYVEYQKSVG